jgi:hypothetical protein
MHGVTFCVVVFLYCKVHHELHILKVQIYLNMDSTFFVGHIYQPNLFFGSIYVISDMWILNSPIKKILLIIYSLAFFMGLCQ